MIILPRTVAGRRRPRVLLAAVLLLIMAGLYGIQTAQLWSTANSGSDTVDAQRHGLAYLRPLLRLTGELTTAQSVAVRGDTVNAPAVTTAANAVAEADLTYGAALRTTQRWSQLRIRIDEVLTDDPGGQAALERYGDVLVLAEDLARTVGNSSELLLDSEVDSHHLMEAVTLQIPQVLVEAGRAADLAALATGGFAPPEGQQLVQVHVARYQAARAADAIGAGMSTALETTDRDTLGENLAAPMDEFRTAINQLAPPATLVPSGGQVDATDMAAAADQVRDTALSLATVVLAELDGLMADRTASLADQRTLALVTTIAGIMLGVALLWWSVPAHDRPTDRDMTEEPDADAAQPGDVAAIAVQLPVVDPRDLIEMEELLHVGRGVRARPKDRDDDAQ